MENRWSDAEARSFVKRYDERGVNEDVALRVYTSRLIGSDPTLVLHGGGNTSVKTHVPDDTGRETRVLCVKGSGWDLGDIEPQGLPAVRLDPLLQLREREALTDEEMVNAQRTRLLDASAPNPSVETLLHAFLPHKFVDHSHAAAILSLVDQPDAEALCREVFGERLGIVPYVMPGFDLSKLAAEVYERDRQVEGLVLLRHGLFTFGETARESYERHVAAVDAAEARVARARGSVPASGARDSSDGPGSSAASTILPILRGCLGDEGRRTVLHVRSSKALRDFAADPAVGDLSQRGVATPDHVIRTKRFPLLIDDPEGVEPETLRAHVSERVAAYRAGYRAYVERQARRSARAVTPLDPDPRVVLVPGLGVVAAGASEKAARVAADLYEQTVDVIRGAEAVGRYRVLDEDDLFDMEYWSLEQAKLGKASPPPLAGRVVLVSGAASGIGAATARRFAKAGAHLWLVDVAEEPLRELAEELASVGCGTDVVDVTDEAAVRASVERAVARFGGLDGCVSNAGTAPQGAIADVETAVLEHSLRINLLAHQYLASALVRVLRLQGTGGFLLFNASKAAFNPGSGFGPYAVAKAALVALMRQYALEGGELGIRANAVNADRVRTGLLPGEVVRQREAARGLEPGEYFRSNLLHREVTADDVAEAFLALALAESTTGSVATVDGGNIAAAPR
ncbi:MAG: bifunctional aldolase/short-chain dehydrogenase [Myxococcota bacterium]|nr:bifunctional aldolase/short-chain dehydrogenase [Myxococcota bacterium]